MSTMNQRQKIYGVTKSPTIRKQEKKLATEFSKLNVKEAGIMYEILAEYNRLKNYGGETPSIFLSNLEYMVPLLHRQSLEITKRSTKKN